jgi:TolB-like protein/Tfp pilus assembly protein PilF
MAVIILSLLPSRVEAIDSIAVLPFENLTGDAGKDYFVDGATDEVIGQLAKIGALRVISRTSVMQFKGVDKLLPEIARELNVDVVVEGTVYQIGENVRIRVQLIDVLPEEQNLWADNYDRPMTEVMIMYSEIARTIANKTQINLTAEEMTRLTSASQVNPESYDAYLKGRSHWYKLIPSELKLALQYFNLAVQLDPNNALAHVGVAIVWGARYQMGIAARHEAQPLRKAAIEKALELDNTLAEAHAALAGYSCWGEWHWETAEKEYQQTLKLSPNDSFAHAYYSHFLCHMGRTEEALPHIELAIELDPLNPTYHALYGQVLVYNRRFDDALIAARTTLDMVPNHGVAHGVLQNVFLAEGMRDEWLTHQQQRIANDPERVAAFERGLEEGGYESAQRGIAEVLATRYERPQYASAKGLLGIGVARRYLDAGDYDQAIDWLERAYDEHSPSLPYIGQPHWDPLRSYPRFQSLLRRIGLPTDEKE